MRAILVSIMLAIGLCSAGSGSAFARPQLLTITNSHEAGAATDISARKKHRRTGKRSAKRVRVASRGQYAAECYTGMMPCEGVPRLFDTVPAYSKGSKSVAAAVTRVARSVESSVRMANGLVAPLASKVAEITSDCGSHVISGVRHTFIAGTRHISLHASGKAADVQGNPSCIYSHLAGWPGGYSTDYATAPGGHHVHISYDAEGGREMGVRFVHHHVGGRHRYAHHGHHARRMRLASRR